MNKSMAQKKIKNRNNSLELMVCFIAVFFSSIVGSSIDLEAMTDGLLKIDSISLNTIAPIPLLLYLLFTMKRISIPVKTPYFWFLLICLLSSILALTRTFLPNEYLQTNIYTAIQIAVLALPLCILLYSRNRVVDSLKLSLKYTCRIQALWAIAQYILWTIFNFNLTEVFLGDFLGGLGQEEWTNLSGTQIGNAFRLTGLNHEGAFLGFLLIIGFAIDESNYFRGIYFLCAALSTQRATILGFAALFLAFIIIGLFDNKRSGSSVITKTTIATITIKIIVIVAIVVLLINIPAIQETLLKFLYRFNLFNNQGSMLILTDDIGTARHLLLIPETFIQLTSLTPDISVLGVGFKSSGVIFTSYHNAIEEYLGNEFLGRVWTIESDFASVFAGVGIAGGICYLVMYWSYFRKYSGWMRALIVSLFCFGFAYNFSQLVIFQIIYAIFSSETGSAKISNHKKVSLMTTRKATENMVRNKNRKHESFSL